MIKELIAGYKLDIVSHRTHTYGDTDEDVIRGEAKADKLEEVIQDLERIQDLMDWGNDERQESKEIRVIQMEDGKFIREFSYSQGQADWTLVTKPEEAMDLNTTRNNADLVERAMIDPRRGGKVKTFTVSVTEKV